MKKSLFHGALRFERRRGYLIPCRFAEAQVASVSYSDFFVERTRCGASITLEMITEATEISFGYKLFKRTGVRSTFEVYTDGFLTHLVGDDTLPDEGALSFSFKEGKKRIEIYLPNYSEVGIKSLAVNGAYRVMPRRKTKVLFLGDSITQGGGSKRSAQTYVNVAKRALGWEIVNQGIGGYVFEKNLLSEIPFSPDKIVVSLGTNHCGYDEQESRRRITEFFEAFHEIYGDKKTLVILPVYCGNPNIENRTEKYRRIKAEILEIASRYPNVQFVSAYEMVPHLEDYYMEDMIHPNALGMELYGQNLAREIKKIKF